jgi:hypothetical protein
MAASPELLKLLSTLQLSIKAYRHSLPRPKLTRTVNGKEHVSYLVTFHFHSKVVHPSIRLCLSNVCSDTGKSSIKVVNRYGWAAALFAGFGMVWLDQIVKRLLSHHIFHLSQKLFWVSAIFGKGIW